MTKPKQSQRDDEFEDDDDEDEMDYDDETLLVDPEEIGR
jgi:hypothetical protein